MKKLFERSDTGHGMSVVYGICAIFMKQKFLKRSISFVFNRFFAKIFASWFLCAAVTMVFYPENITLGFISGTRFITFTVLFAAVFFFFSCLQEKGKNENISEVSLILSLLVFSCLLLMRTNENMYVCIPLAVFFVLAMRFYYGKKPLQESDLPKKVILFLICLTAVFFGHVILTISVLRYKTYSSPNFDFGIFCNMYYNMRKNFLPTVSCERDRILSHFAVHISPALYVFLPVYAVFPSPVTVAVCQVLAIYSGIIPFFLIAKKRGVTGKTLVLLSVVFAASPVLGGGCMFDFHENCLLVPFLMWMFWFYENKKTIPMLLFAVLTLLIKEDAFIYVCVFAVYIIIADKKIKKGAGLFVMAVSYFIVACSLLKAYGTGIMAGRYEIMIQDGGSLFGIIKTIFSNPGYTVSTIFADENDPTAKLFYFMRLMLPLAFAPFLTKKHARLILMLPVFLNLLTAYGYQYDIFFQYSFGICAFLLYGSLLNMSDMKKEKMSFAAAVSAGLSIMLFFMLLVPEYGRYAVKYAENREVYERMDVILSEIPEDKSVAAGAFILPKLSGRTEIYETYYHKTYDTDYAILDIRPGYYADSMKIAEEYENAGYELIYIENDCLMILKK